MAPVFMIYYRFLEGRRTPLGEDQPSRLVSFFVWIPFDFPDASSCVRSDPGQRVFSNQISSSGMLRTYSIQTGSDVRSHGRKVLSGNDPLTHRGLNRNLEELSWDDFI